MYIIQHHSEHKKWGQEMIALTKGTIGRIVIVLAKGSE